MGVEQADIQHIELTRELTFPGDVRFDPEKVVLQGVYRDQLSAYRARKVWVETLESCFLLDDAHDFEISIDSKMEEGIFLLNCSFLSACGRYAFWRLTNEQAPEAQYIIETAHIPNSELRSDDFMSAPDLKPLIDEPRTRGRRAEKPERNGTLTHVDTIVKRIRAWLES